MPYTLEDIHNLCVEAYVAARENERSKYAQLAFEVRLETDLSSLARRLYRRTWHPSPPIVFPKPDPVPREIFAPVFEDRVVSHIVYNIMTPIFERLFIYDSASCRKGKGTQFGVSRFEHHIRSATNNWQREAYVLSLDISGYFMSINRTLLLRMVNDVITRYEREFDDADWLRYVVREIILRDPLKGCKRMGDWSIMARVPPQKRMECAKPDCGLILGDVDSQMFSNLYLTAFDNFVKRTLGIRHYIRYVDDARMLHPSREYLTECLMRSRAFLADTLCLTLHPEKCTIESTKGPVTFLGVTVSPHYTTIAPLSGRRLYVGLLRIDGTQTAEKRLSTLNSYMGYVTHKRCRRIVNAALRHTPIRHNLAFSNNRYIN